jgi:hypothetical protein
MATGETPPEGAAAMREEPVLQSPLERAVNGTRSGCRHFLTPPGPGGFCFYYLRPRAGSETQFPPFCACPEREDTECFTAGKMYLPHFPEAPGVSDRKSKGKRRRRKG